MLVSPFFLKRTSASFAEVGTYWPIFIWLSVFPLGTVLLRRRDATAAFYLLLLLLLLGGVSSVLVLDYFGSCFLHPRQLPIYTPCFLLESSAESLTLFRDICSRFAAGSSLGIVDTCLALLMMVLSVGAIWFPVRHVFAKHKQDWREVARYLLAELAPEDLLLTDTPHILFYLPELASRIEPLNTVADIESRVQTHTRVRILSPGGLLGRRRPDSQQWIGDACPLQVASDDAGVKLFVCSAAMDASQIVEQLLQGGGSALDVFTSVDLLERALSACHAQATEELIGQILSGEQYHTQQNLGLAVSFARELSDRGEHDRAVDILTKVNAISDCQGWSTLGLVFNRQDRTAEAITAFQKAIECNPDAYWANHLLAGILFGQGEWRQTIQLEERACQIAPTDSLRLEPLLLIARAYSRLGEDAKGCEALRQAQEVGESQAILAELAALGCRDEP